MFGFFPGFTVRWDRIAWTLVVVAAFGAGFFIARSL